MFKSKKGITLVALVITIIVLLILAGVSISLVVGDNGVMTKAQNASKSTKYSQMKEAVGLAISDLQTEYANNMATNVSATLDTFLTEQKLNKELEEYGYTLYKTSLSGTTTTSLTAGETALDTQTIYAVAASSSPTDYVAFQVKLGTVGCQVYFGTELGKTPAIAVWNTANELVTAEAGSNWVK
jgi:hypothetical protein